MVEVYIYSEYYSVRRHVKLLLASILANLFTDRNATIWDECITQGTLCAGSIVAGSISNPVPVALKGLI
jgi:hypothetical protein